MSDSNLKVSQKLKLLALARELGSVSAACRIFGVSRDTFYRAQHAFSTGGEQALHDITRRKPNYKNRVPAEVEEAVLKFSLAKPSYGQVRISRELAKQGIVVSPAGVRCIWQRHNLETAPKRSEHSRPQIEASRTIARESAQSNQAALGETTVAQIPNNRLSERERVDYDT